MKADNKPLSFSRISDRHVHKAKLSGKSHSTPKDLPEPLMGDVVR